MTCKDCIHYDVCENHLNYQRKTIKGKTGYLKVHKTKCPYEKNKSENLYIVRRVGECVYAYCKSVNQVVPYEIEDIHIDKEQTRYFATAFDVYYKEFLDEIEFTEDDFGKTVFLTKSEAEQKLKELKENA
ncbi:MAG: hypothetical protein K2F67_07610 [Eubacterium sp.]|nr:hypothetical protein [Eubacterium sp.]